MGLADRDYMRERERQRRASEHAERLDPPEPSATSTLWYILFFLSIAFIGFKAASWWESTHPKHPMRPAPQVGLAPAAPVMPTATPLPESRQRNQNLTGNWDPNRLIAPSASALASTPATTTIVIKCVINGVTTYADSEADCLARAKATVVTIDARQNLSDGLPNAPQIIQRPSPAPQVVATPAAVDPNVQRQALCQAYEQEIKWTDERARQPLSGQEQDWLAAKRKKARDEQFRLRC
jgi:hypothetical protein